MVIEINTSLRAVLDTLLDIPRPSSPSIWDDPRCSQSSVHSVIRMSVERLSDGDLVANFEQSLISDI